MKAKILLPSIVCLSALAVSAAANAASDDPGPQSTSSSEEMTVVNPGLTLPAPASAINPASLPASSAAPLQARPVTENFYGPDCEKDVDTKFGKIHIGKGCLVLVIGCDDSFSAYNLHDTGAKSVFAEVNGRKFFVIPTEHVTLAGSHCTEFAAANRLPFVVYNSTKCDKVDNEVFVYHGSFDIASLILRYGPFKALLKSQDSKTKKIADNVLKNAAIMSQLISASRYNRPVTVPVTTPATNPK